MAKPVTLTRRQAQLLVATAGRWQPIMYGREDQRVTAGLLRLDLATADGYPAEKGKAWSLTPTDLGRAMGCLLVRRTGGKLNRFGVELLAKHRAELLRRFDIDGAVAVLLAQFSAYVVPEAARPLAVGALHHSEVTRG